MAYAISAVRFVDSDGADITSDFSEYEGQQCGMVCEYIGMACENRGIMIVDEFGDAITEDREVLCDGSCWKGAGYDDSVVDN